MSRPYTLLLLGSLYLAQGLPYGFFTKALQVLLRDAGLSLKTISLSSLLFIPWALKFLWAPLVDRTGTRRQWLLPLQSLAVLGALFLTQLDLQQSFVWVFAALFFFNVLAAVQDVVTDGLAVRLLGSKERGIGNGLQVGAFRLGMIFGGGGLMWIFAEYGWSVMFQGMAFLLFLCCIPVWFLHDVRTESHAPAESLGALATVWVARLAQPGLAAFIALICFYRFGDTMVSALIGPYLHDYGLSKKEIAFLSGTIGSIAALCGAMIGGALVWNFSRRTVLFICGLLQSLSLAPYWLCAIGVGGKPMLYAANISEHVFGAMATVALFSLMMDACDPDHAGTDYTLLACAVVIAQAISGFIAAAAADALGYAPVMAAGLVLSLVGCGVLVLALDRQAGPVGLDRAWRTIRR